LLNNKVRAHSLVDSVTERLEAAILSGELTAGSKLSELQLALSLGVSRGPLREAIRRLEGRKLLERTTNIGVRVVALSRQDVSEILQIQEVLQGLACGLAAKNMSDADIKGLEQTLTRYKHKPGKGEDYDSWDLDFHTRIITGSGNERLSRMLTEEVNFLLKVHRSVASTTRKTAMRVVEEHKQIVAALARRDPVAAEAAMREHIRHARVESLAADFGEDAAEPKKRATAPAKKASRAIVTKLSR
jgi:DNA-binding GntR family transcriptional regulator